MVVSLYWNPRSVRSGALFDRYPDHTRKVLVIIRNINLVAIHPTVKTVGFLAKRSVKDTILSMKFFNFEI